MGLAQASGTLSLSAPQKSASDLKEQRPRHHHAQAPAAEICSRWCLPAWMSLTTASWRLAGWLACFNRPPQPPTAMRATRQQGPAPQGPAAAKQGLLVATTAALLVACASSLLFGQRSTGRAAAMSASCSSCSISGLQQSLQAPSTLELDILAWCGNLPSSAPPA